MNQYKIDVPFFAANKDTGVSLTFLASGYQGEVGG